MRIRRPIATLFTALALFGGGATMTACQAAGEDQNDGTVQENDPEGGTEEDNQLPDNSDPERDIEDDDTQDPD